MMNYYDFEFNWDNFYKLLHSDDITRLLLSEGLTHPLRRHSDWQDNCYPTISFRDSLPEYKFRNELIHADFRELYSNPEINGCLTEIQKNQMAGGYFDFDKEYERQIQELDNEYNNQYELPESIHMNVPLGCSDKIAKALFIIAQKLVPELEWILIKGNSHSTVVSADRTILFDLLMWYRSYCHFECYSAQIVYFNVIGQTNAFREDELYNTPECIKAQFSGELPQTTMLRFYDFEKNWEEFDRLLHSPKVQELIFQRELHYPLCNYSDPSGILEWVYHFHKPLSNILFGRSHDMSAICFLIAQRLLPEKEWIWLRGNKYSTVYSADKTILFDIEAWCLHMVGYEAYEPLSVFNCSNGIVKPILLNKIFNTLIDKVSSWDNYIRRA